MRVRAPLPTAAGVMVTMRGEPLVARLPRAGGVTLPPGMHTPPPFGTVEFAADTALRFATTPSATVQFTASTLFTPDASTATTVAFAANTALEFLTTSAEVHFTADATLGFAAAGVSGADVVAATALVFDAAPSATVTFTATTAIDGAARGVSAAAFGADTTVAMPASTQVHFTDDFDRADGGLGANWVTVSTYAPVINANKAQCTPDTPTDTTNVAVARWVDPLTSDHIETAATLVSPTGTYTSNDPGSGVWIGSADGTTRVEAMATSGGLKLYSVVGGTRTERDADVSTVNSGTAVWLRRTGSVWTLHVNTSGSPAILTWDDTGGVIPTGAAYRYAGVALLGRRNSLGSRSYGFAAAGWRADDL